MNPTTQEPRGGELHELILEMIGTVVLHDRVAAEALAAKYRTIEASQQAAAPNLTFSQIKEIAQELNLEGAGVVQGVITAAFRIAERDGVKVDAGAGEVKKWQERYAELGTAPNELVAERRKGACKEAEVADLRAQLAATTRNLQTAVREAWGARAQLARLQAPAGESIDTPEFRKLLEAVYYSPMPAMREKEVIALIAHIDAQLARQRQGGGEPVAALTGEQIFNIAAKYFAWDAESWHKATQGTIGMPMLLEYTKAVRSATPAAQAQGEPVAYMRDNRKECTTAANKRWMENAGFGVWADVAASYTIPLYLGPAAQADEVRDAALRKINTIRNSIIGLQSLNWSEHVYPLVAALDEAGYEGMEYPEARKYFGTLLERAVKAEDELAALRTTAADNQEG